MPLVPPVVRAVLVPWSAAVVLVSSSGAGASAEGTPQGAEMPEKGTPRQCILIPANTIRPVVDKGLERSETVRRLCEELGAARAVVVLEWAAAMDSQTHAKSEMTVRDGVVVAAVKIPPVGDTIVLMAHELQHVVERTRGLDLPVEAKRAGSGVWQSSGGYETRAAIDVGHQVAEELRAHSRAPRK